MPLDCRSTELGYGRADDADAHVLREHGLPKGRCGNRSDAAAVPR